MGDDSVRENQARQMMLGLPLAVGLALAGWTASGSAGGRAALLALAPGMTQTEVQSILGAPDYIQVNGRRLAWQYCPHFLERLRQRNGDLVETAERLISRYDGDTEHFITVWFYDGQAEHMRAYPEEGMGACTDFYSAFRWEDNIDGPGFGLGFAGVDK